MTIVPSDRPSKFQNWEVVLIIETRIHAGSFWGFVSWMRGKVEDLKAVAAFNGGRYAELARAGFRI